MQPLIHNHDHTHEIRIHPDDLEDLPVEKLGWLVKRLLVGGDAPVVVGVTEELEVEDE